MSNPTKRATNQKARNNHKMNIKNNASAATLAHENLLEKLENRAEEIADDISEARQNVAAVQGRFIDGDASHADLIAAEQSAAALSNAAEVLAAKISVTETKLQKSNDADERQRKHAQALALAEQVEKSRAAALTIGAATAAAISEGVPQTAAAIFAAADVSRRLKSLLNSPNAPTFDNAAETRRMLDLAGQDVPAISGAIYHQLSGTEVFPLFVQIMEKKIHGFSVEPPSASKAPADLSDLNFLVGADVQMREILFDSKMGQLDAMKSERGNG